MHRYEHLHIGIFSDIRSDSADGFNDSTGAREEGPHRFQRKHPLKFLQFSIFQRKHALKISAIFSRP